MPQSTWPALLVQVIHVEQQFPEVLAVTREAIADIRLEDEVAIRRQQMLDD